MPAPRKRGGSAPRYGDTAADKRLPLRISPEQLEAWKALAAERGVNLSELVRAAVAHFATCDRPDKPDHALADLGAEVLEVVRRRFPGRKV